MAAVRNRDQEEEKKMGDLLFWGNGGEDIKIVEGW